ncbi:MAG: GGDEF-domain containing protein [Idiomarinaceae bacterium]|nr:GGDEF-domain containing protein [Idiomarinaceae bacterium]|tara:strand:- start:1165 stop:3696 length:2532 start_codon:yes stop_codon:yes gene_type:complete
MIKNFTQSAAILAYWGITLFFAVIVLLGLLDLVVTPASMLMNVISDYILIAAGGACLFLILLRRWRTPKQLSYVSPTLISLGISTFIVLQLLVWGVLPVPEAARFSNPFTLALTSVMLLMFFVALTLRHNYPKLKVDASRPTLFLLGSIIILGVSVWYAMSARIVHLETDNARTKIRLIGNMIDSRFTVQTRALERIKQRVEQLGASETEKLLATDLATYIRDYEIIEGMLILDDRQQPILSSSFAEGFWQLYMRGNDGIQNWLAQPSDSSRIAANGQSLNTETPIVMIAVPLVTNHEANQLVALLNFNDLVAANYLEYLSAIKTFMAFTPAVLVAMQGSSDSIRTLQELQDTYPHLVNEKVTLVTGIEHDFYSVLVDYSPLQEATRLHQMLLWLTGAFAFIYILAADTTKRLRAKSRKLATMARFDELTGFLRRDAFNLDTQELMVNCEGCRRAVLFINLDKFNSINDGLGHQMGDQVLKQTAQRIKNVITGADVFARFTNDEFIAYYRDTTAHQLKKDAQAALQAIAEVYVVEDLSVHLTASIGIAVATQAQIKTDQLMQFADIAMDAAKAAGGNQFAIYQNDMQTKHERLVEIRTQLQVAMNEERLEAFYQPIYSAETGKIVSVESLVRWRKDGSFISPASFIPIAEQTGQIVQLGQQMLRIVMRDLVQFPELRELTVAVNVSPHQLQRSGFVSDLIKQLKSQAIEPQQLTLELTEAVMSEGGSTQERLRELRKYGLHVAIDDFGTGFSSLAYLTEQPADIIKIDRAFTLGVEKEGKQRNLLIKMIEMCKQLDKTVVVEGVETAEQVALFKAAGVDRLQGFYFAKPMPIDELIKLLSNKA